MRLILFCLVICIGLCGCNEAPIEVKYRGQTMGTSWSVKTVSDEGYLESVAAAIQDELDLIESLMSNWNSESDISRFNASELESCTPVSKLTLAVILVSQRIASLSDGAFDVSVGPLVDLWGFGTRVHSAKLPDEEDVAAALDLTGLEQLYLTDNELCKRSVPVQLNLSGIAKGYAVDRVSMQLEELGIDNYLVEVGGELRGRGLSGRSQIWTVGIEQPTDDLGLTTYQMTVLLDDMAVATSGDYRNFYQLGDVRYSHIIDPSTGYPVLHNTASVTVLGRASIEADAWATALLVLGPEAGMQTANELKLPVLMILRTEQGFEVVSSNYWPNK